MYPRKHQPSSEEDKAMTPEEKLERNRIRNRDHSRRSRQRKKALLEGMKNQVWCVVVGNFLAPEMAP